MKCLNCHTETTLKRASKFKTWFKTLLNIVAKIFINVFVSNGFGLPTQVQFLGLFKSELWFSILMGRRIPYVIYHQRYGNQ